MGEIWQQQIRSIRYSVRIGKTFYANSALDQKGIR